MTGWVIWLVLAAAALIVELFTLTLVFGLIAGALVLTGLVAALGAPLSVQLLVLAVSAAVGSLLLRPLARRHRHQPAALRSGVAALEGRTAVVTQEINHSGGRVRLGGESWAARSLFDENIPVGADVVVSRVDGATVLVFSKEL
jgi:membrane protein implicated in regulation of membrane protease activity